MSAGPSAKVFSGLAETCNTLVFQTNIRLSLFPRCYQQYKRRSEILLLSCYVAHGIVIFSSRTSTKILKQNHIS